MHLRIWAAVACSLLLAVPAFGASQGDWDDCKASGDQSIAGCTRIINDGNESPRNRAIAYNNRGNAWCPRSRAAGCSRALITRGEAPFLRAQCSQRS